MSDLRQQNALLMTTEFVLIEVANALCAPAFRAQTIALIDSLHTMPHFHIVSASTTLLADGWKLYCTRLDKEWNLTDCTSFIAMQQENISQAFTSDHHFEQAGFIKLL
jgi:predicted nucleic acid-binding protein